MAEVKYHGAVFTNDDGLPEVKVTLAAQVRDYRSYQVETDRDIFQFGVTPTGYLRVFEVRHKPKVRKP
jgi:hypothetical protein